MKWLVWSFEHKGWWLSNWGGYTTNINEAGRFSFESAQGIVTEANRHLTGDGPEETMCPDYMEDKHYDEAN
jgi:hypothetical protein